MPAVRRTEHEADLNHQELRPNLREVDRWKWNPEKMPQNGGINKRSYGIV